jgi:serine/threonine protein kinase
MTDKSKINTESTELDEIIAEFIFADEAGEPVSRDGLLAKHPEYAIQLDQFFADRDQFKRLASPLSPEAARRNDLPTTVRYFGDYELLEEIAQGGMGVVYKARQQSLNRIVAVKMVLAGHLACDQDIKRFEEEARTAATLKHRSIVPIHEVGRQHGQHYFSMDYIDGRNLAEVIRTEPPSPDQAARIIKDIAEAVDYAHGEGIVHRDIKPSNILIDQSGGVRITDFGLALRVEDKSGLTQTGQILGTPSYMPPEQALGKRDVIGPAADIYAMGAILYEMLTGRPPFRGESASDTIRQLLDTEPLSPAELDSRTPRDLETICLKCLEKDTHQRYGTAALMADDLSRFLADQPIFARPVSSTHRFLRWCRRERKVASLTAVIALLLVIGTAVSTYFAVQADRRANAEALARQLLEQRQIERDDALGELGKAWEKIAALNSVLRVDPKDEHSLIARGDLYGRLGMLKQAGEDYLMAVALQPNNSWTYMTAAMLQLEAGDPANFERIRRTMLKKYANTEESIYANQTAVTALRVTPADSDQLAIAATMARQGLSLSEEERPQIPAQMGWAHLANALAEFRKQNYRDAIQWCVKRRVYDSENQSDHWLQKAEAHYVSAMAYWHLDQPGKARSELVWAKRLSDAHEPNFAARAHYGWKYWLDAQPLRQEAESMILGDLVRFIELGMQFGAKGQWAEALENFKFAYESGAEPYGDWNLKYAALLLEAGEYETYASLCRNVLEEHQDTDDSASATMTAKTCLLDPSADDLFDAAGELAVKSVELSQIEQNRFVASWAKLACGLAEYRAGRHRAAVDWCEKSLAIPVGGWSQLAQAHLVTAMAQSKQGNREGATAAMTFALDAMEANRPDFSRQNVREWQNWLICQHFLDEAQSLIDVEATAASKRQPDSSSE